MRLLHLSDLHFSGAYVKGGVHSHDLALLTAISDIVPTLNYDKVIVSGDLSDDGLPQSLNNARNYLLESLNPAPQTSIGLKLGTCGPGKRLSVVGGNHDAHNAESGSGIAKVIWQKSMVNFYEAFPEAKSQSTDVQYEWIDQGKWGVFVCYLDTCFLGDPSTSESGESVFITDRIAVGKLALGQSSRVLDIYHRGVRGTLVDPVTDTTIDPGKFAKAFKILVAHHYLFEQGKSKVDFFHRLRDRNRAFQNIAMSDFDLLLCGHKHESFIETIFYSEYFDRRARTRYSFNYLRCILGLTPLPVQERDDKRKRVSRVLTTLAQIAQLLVRRSGAASPLPVGDKHLSVMLAEKIIEWIDRPDQLVKVVDQILKDGPVDHDFDPDEAAIEVREILREYLHLTTEKRKMLTNKFRALKGQLSDFENRIFSQSMCGSSAKRSASRRSRHFYTYDIKLGDRGYEFVATRYDAKWNSEKSDERVVFLEYGQKTNLVFNNSRVYPPPDGLFGSSGDTSAEMQASDSAAQGVSDGQQSDIKLPVAVMKQRNRISPQN